MYHHHQAIASPPPLLPGLGSFPPFVLFFPELLGMIFILTRAFFPSYSTWTALIQRIMEPHQGLWSSPILTASWDKGSEMVATVVQLITQQWCYFGITACKYQSCHFSSHSVITGRRVSLWGVPNASHGRIKFFLSRSLILMYFLRIGNIFMWFKIQNSKCLSPTCVSQLQFPSWENRLGRCKQTPICFIQFLHRYSCTDAHSLMP